MHPVDTQARPATRLRWWKEALTIAAFYGLYSIVRNTQGSASVSQTHAYRNATLVIRIERRFHLFFERGVQQVFEGMGAATRVFFQFWNTYYGVAHFVVTIVALVWLFRRDPQRYPLWRNTLALTTGLALIGFATFPLMPPRLLPFHELNVLHLSPPTHHFVDTLDKFGGPWSFENGPISKVSNQFAAMPSLHFGWSSWCACVMYPMLRRRWTRVLAVAYPFITLFAIVVTANHYILDAVGGAFVFGLAFLLARWATPRMEARWDRRTDAGGQSHVGALAETQPRDRARS